MTNINFLRFLDKLFIIILIFLFPIKSLSSRKNKTLSKDKKRILVIRLWGIGDVVNLIPIINTLNKNDYQIDVLTVRNLEFLFKNLEFVNKIYIFNFNSMFNFFKIIIKLNKNNYDIIIDSEQFLNISTIFSTLIKSNKKIGYSHLFRSNFYTKKIEYIEDKHFIENFYSLLEPIGIKLKKNELKLIPLKYNKNSIKKVDNIIKKYKLNRKKIITINLGTGASAISRRWDKENFVKLENKLSSHKNYVVVFTGVEIENQIYKQIKSKLSKKHISLINKLNLSDFIYFLTKINLFISNDTGSMHLSAAMGTKTIGLFGLNSPKKVGAWPLDKNENIYLNPKNNPIINNKYSIYPNEKYSTINLITVDMVYNKALKLLENKK